MSLNSSSRSHRIASVCVAALLAANSAVLVTGLANAVETVVGEAKPRTIAIITSPDGTQFAVDPTTPAGRKAIADAHARGDDVATVPAPDAAVAASKGSGGNPAVTIPGVSATDLQRLLTGTVEYIKTTITTIVDSAGKTVVSIVDATLTTVSSIVGGTATTVSSIVGGTATTVSSIVDNTATTVTNTPTTILNTATTVSSIVDNTATTVTNTPTTLTSTVTSLQTTVTTILGGVGL